jgi:hypothetical protein
MFAGALAGCALAPLPPEPPLPSAAQPAPRHAVAERHAQLELYQRPPGRLFGIMLEQGSLDAAPDVAAMVEFQQRRKAQRAASGVPPKAAPQWLDLGPLDNLGRIIDIAFHPQNSSIIYAASPAAGRTRRPMAGPPGPGWAGCRTRRSTRSRSIR